MQESTTDVVTTDFDLKAYFCRLQKSVVFKEPETAMIVESMQYSLMTCGKCIWTVILFGSLRNVGEKRRRCWEVETMPTAVALEMNSHHGQRWQICVAEADQSRSCLYFAFQLEEAITERNRYLEVFSIALQRLVYMGVDLGVPLHSHEALLTILMARSDKC